MSVKKAMLQAANARFVDFIATQLKERKWNRADFASAMKIEFTSSLRRVLLGQARANVKTLDRFSRALSIPIEELQALYDPLPPQKRQRRQAAKFEPSTPYESKSLVQILPKPALPSTPNFSMTSNGNGMNIALNLENVSYEQAFKIMDVLRAIGMFSERDQS